MIALIRHQRHRPAPWGMAVCNLRARSQGRLRICDTASAPRGPGSEPGTLYHIDDADVTVEICVGCGDEFLI